MAERLWHCTFGIMFMRKRRRTVSLLLVLGLLFSQLAVAAYACTTHGPADQSIEEAVADTVPCDQMDMSAVLAHDDPLRCLEHCKHGQQHMSSMAPVDLSVGLMVAPFDLPPPTSAESAFVVVQHTLLSRSTSPPAYARSQRLRI